MRSDFRQSVKFNFANARGDNARNEAGIAQASSAQQHHCGYTWPCRRPLGSCYRITDKS